MPAYVTCVKLPEATSTRRKRDAEVEAGWETRVKARRGLEGRAVVTETVRV